MDKANKSNTIPSILIISRGLVIYEDKILLMQRELNGSYFPGKWELPGGKLDLGETLEQNLIREVSEESGLKHLHVIRNDVAVINEIGKTGKYKGYLAITILGVLHSKDKNVRLSKEHINYKWENIENATHLDLVESTEILLKRIQTEEIIIPC